MHALAPATAAYEPAAHAVQPDVPVVIVLYVPMVHAAQDDPLVYVPTGQDVQKSIETAPASL